MRRQFKAHIQPEMHMQATNLSQHLRRLFDDCPYVRKRLDVGDLELYPKLNFNGYDEVDVVERIPVRNVLTPSFHRQLDRVVEQQIAKDSGEG